MTQTLPVRDPYGPAAHYSDVVVDVLLKLTCSHGGEHVSKYVSEHLHELFESVESRSIPDIIRYTKSHGDYFNRWRGGGLRRWMPDSVEGTPEEGSGMTFEERLVLAFLTVRPPL
jgi:hypothetical protein